MDSKLGVIEVKDIMNILDTMGKLDCLAAIKQQSAQEYEGSSYEYTLLKPFTKRQDTKDGRRSLDASAGMNSASVRGMGASVRKSKMSVQTSIRNLSSSDRVNRRMSRGG